MNDYIKLMRKHIGCERLSIVGAGVFIHKDGKPLLQNKTTMVAGRLTTAVITLLESISDPIALPNDNRSATLWGISEAILLHGGHLQMNYIFQLYMGRKAD